MTLFFLRLFLFFSLSFFLPACFFPGFWGKEAPAVGVVSITGAILDSQEVLEELKNFVSNKRVRAIIVRLESPGGAVGASQEIYEAILKVREEKPVVASMGGLAASGAFYIASACSAVVANPGTLTGSIGVIVQLFDLSELLRWARIKVEVIKTGEFKDAGAFHRPLTPRETRYFQDLADRVLAQFVRDIARGRGGKVNEKKLWQIADGRVFTGEEALKLGLVDELGGWEKAVEVARSLAGLKEEPEIVRSRKKWWSRFLEERSLEERAVAQLMNPLWVIFIP